MFPKISERFSANERGRLRQAASYQVSRHLSKRQSLRQRRLFMQGLCKYNHKPHQNLQLLLVVVCESFSIFPLSGSCLCLIKIKIKIFINLLLKQTGLCAFYFLSYTTFDSTTSQSSTVPAPIQCSPKATSTTERQSETTFDEYFEIPCKAFAVAITIRSLLKTKYPSPLSLPPLVISAILLPLHSTHLLLLWAV
jgi:hypothetical protein